MQISKSAPEVPSAVPRHHGGMLHNFRRYVADTDRCVSEFDAELSLRNRGVRFIHLIDFQEIYAYLAPYLLHREERRPFINRHHQACELLSNPVEKIFFPLGTLAEVSSFVQQIRRRMEALHRITLATNLDRAMDEFLSFFLQEHFLDKNRANEWLEASKNSSGGSRLLTLQTQALDLLSDFEKGASMLHRLLTQESVVEVQRIIRQHPPDINTVHYRNFLNELQQIRASRKKTVYATDFSNMVDAANASMAIALNERFNSPNPAGAPWMFFKVVTDTNSLFKLSDLFERQLIYRDYHGFDLRLFETARDVLLKRFLRKASELGGRELINTLTNSAGKVRNALRDLEFLAADCNVTPEQLLEGMVGLPTGQDITGVAQNVTKLLEGVRDLQLPKGLLQRRLLSAEARDELGEAHDRSEIVARPYSARGVIELQGLLQSVEKVIEDIDVINVDLTSGQKSYSKREWNPVLTIEALGFERKISRDSDNRIDRLEVVWKKSGELVFRADRVLDVCTVSWPTALGAAQQIPILASLFGSDEPVEGLAIFLDGREQRFRTVRLLSPIADRDDCVFIRADARSLAYVTELFSTDPEYTLISGLIFPGAIKNPEILLMVQFFASLGLARIPNRLLVDALDRFYRLAAPETSRRRT